LQMMSSWSGRIVILNTLLPLLEYFALFNDSEARSTINYR
jgi:hypothetical protein